MTAITPFRPTTGARRVLERSAEIAAEHGGHVTIADLSLALMESANGGDLPGATLHELRRTNRLLGELIQAQRQLTAALTSTTQEATTSMATISEAIQQFQTAADSAHADSQAERDVTDRAIKAMQDLEAALGGANLSADQEQAVGAALAELGQSHTELTQRVTDLGAAADAASPTPPAPPAP